MKILVAECEHCKILWLCPMGAEVLHECKRGPHEGAPTRCVTLGSCIGMSDADFGRVTDALANLAGGRSRAK